MQIIECFFKPPTPGCSQFTHLSSAFSSAAFALNLAFPGNILDLQAANEAGA